MCTAKSEPQYDVSLISGSVHQIGISQADDDALVGSGDLTLSTRDPLQVTLASNIGGTLVAHCFIPSWLTSHK